MQMEILVGSENRENEIINVKGQKLLQKGFLQYDGQLSEKQLPELKENDNVNVRFELVQKETNPPERFTVKSKRLIIGQLDIHYFITHNDSK